MTRARPVADLARRPRSRSRSRRRLGSRSKARNALAAACALTAGALAGAAGAESTTYRLLNHPDGDVANPPYGLRLDELLNVSASNVDVWTFDFENPDSDVRLVFDDAGTPSMSDDSVRIFGTVFGGFDTGSGYGDPTLAGLWDLDFQYTANFSSVGTGGDDIEIADNSPANLGSITPLFDLPALSQQMGVPIPLVDKASAADGFSFRFNNSEDHRLDGTGMGGPEFFTGRGWLTHGGGPHVMSSDFLFVGVVPEAQTALLFLVALAGLRGARYALRG